MWMRLFAVVRTLIVGAIFVSLWTWFFPRWFAAEKGISLEIRTGWPLVLMIAGGIVVVRCALDFAWTGLGTPAPFDPPRRFVAVGFYRWVRNPMYLGMALVLIGEALLVRGIRAEMFVMIVVLWAVVASFVVLYEEPTLKRLFGDEYERYRREVPRWIPRLSPYRGPA
jgi:protein-S-isoprenylcysteine O-methyltransferase Ste14